MIKEASKNISKRSFFYYLILIYAFCAGQYAVAQTSTFVTTAAVSPSDRICGKWMSEEKNCIVQVYKAGNEFGAKLLWFDDSDDKSKPMNTRTDYKNPDPNLQNRKIIGMDVLDDLVYVPKTDTWENGIIYDAKSGRKWSSAVSFTSSGTLKVTGFWHFKFIGKTMTFKRI